MRRLGVEFRQEKSMPDEAQRILRVEMPEVEWIGASRDFLEENYPGKWIGVKDRQLIAVADTLEEVYAIAESKGIRDPVVSGVRKAEYRGAIFVR